MIGRKQELDLLEKLYTSPSFQFLIMYGRRRVGKTTILQKFAQTHDCIFFPAQEKNDPLNREDFSRTVQEYYTDDYIAPFPDWEKALSFIDKHSGPDRRTVLIIDELPFLAEQNPSIKSIFQHTIDHSWQNKNIFLIFCGSSVSFMINEIMGYKSPLYGRITSHLEVRPFDYLESAAFFLTILRKRNYWLMAFSEEFPAISGHSIPLRVLRKILPDTFYRKIPISMMNPSCFYAWNYGSRAYTTASLRPSPMEQIRLPPFLTVSTKTAANAQNICKYCKISAS